jgi:hypothetical protein
MCWFVGLLLPIRQERLNAPEGHPVAYYDCLSRVVKGVSKKGQFLILSTPRPAPSPVQEMVRITGCAHCRTFGDHPTFVVVSARGNTRNTSVPTIDTTYRPPSPTATPWHRSVREPKAGRSSDTTRSGGTHADVDARVRTGVFWSTEKQGIATSPIPGSRVWTRRTANHSRADDLR